MSSGHVNICVSHSYGLHHPQSWQKYGKSSKHSAHTSYSFDTPASGTSIIWLCSYLLLLFLISIPCIKITNIKYIQNKRVILRQIQLLFSIIILNENHQSALLNFKNRFLNIPHHDSLADQPYCTYDAIPLYSIARNAVR